MSKGQTVSVIGDGAVGLSAVLASKQLGAERIILMGRHADRTDLGRDFGATDVVAERGREGIAKVVELTRGEGSHVVIEAVGHRPAYDQSVGIVRAGGVISRVGVPQYQDAPVGFASLFGRNLTLTGGPAPVRAYLQEAIPLVLDGTIDPGRVFDTTMSLEQTPQADAAMDARDAQGHDHPLTRCRATAPKTVIMGRMALPTPTLDTARLVLRPFTAADHGDLFALHASARVMRYWDSAPWTDATQADRFLARCRDLEEQGSGARVALERRDDGAFLGWCGVQHWDPDNRSTNLGYVLAERAWGQGYATEAAGALLRWAFDELDLNRVEAQCDTRNEPSAHVLEKLGFVREGTLREHVIVDGEVSDDWTYGLLRREWRVRRNADR